MSRIHSIGDLRRYMELKSISPEQLASSVGISNMTIRRLLKRKDAEVMPPKYYPHFEKLFATTLSGFDSVVSDLERAGMNIRDTAALEEQFRSRIEDGRIDKKFLTQLKAIAKYAFKSSVTKKTALCIGAILYFVNPLDMIPDFMGPMGLVDDFGVVALVYAIVAKSDKSKG